MYDRNKATRTVGLWELHGLLVPASKSIKKIYDLFELPLEYLGEYYSLYFNMPEKLFLQWKEDNKHSYSECIEILQTFKSEIISFVHGRFRSSYDMYLKIKKVGVF